MDKNEIINNLKGKGTEKYIRLRYPDDYNKIISLPGNSWSEKLYNYLYNCPEHKCIICGKDTKFKGISNGYNDVCSQKCACVKSRITIKEKYGVDNISQLDSIKKKKKESMIANFGSLENAYSCRNEKTKHTNLEKYGVDNISQLDSIKKKKIESMIANFGSLENAYKYRNEKIEHTNLEKYGVKNVSQNNEIRQKIKSANLKKYGEIDWNLAEAKKHHPEILYFDNNKWICSCPHPECQKCIDKQFITYNQLHNDRKRYNYETCTILNPIDNNYSYSEKELLDWINNELNIYCIENTRNIIDKELDIYIPSKNIAIEFNGIYWHSDNFKEKNYHVNKWEQCREKNIQLLSIWEDWWITKKDIIKSLISSKLGIYKERIYARKCIIKEVSAKESHDFENKNHIQGKCQSKIRLGLYYNDELVSLMTFGKLRLIKNKMNYGENCYELLRFCNKLNTQVIGGASKLLKYFIKINNPKQIISYCSNDISNGDIYKQLGFQFDSLCKNTYWYINNDFKRYHRYTFSKKRLIEKELIYKSYNLTESQIMKKLGYYKIFDSGTSKWILNIA